MTIPLDKASFTFKITVPEGLEVVANGVLRDEESEDGKATWTWHAAEPMATYLATASVGKFQLNRYKKDRISYVDAIDPDLFKPVVTARTGRNFAWSHSNLNSYTRLMRTISVPTSGATLSFGLQRDIEPQFDFAFVEARLTGAASWTTLRDGNGHTTDSAGNCMPRPAGASPVPETLSDRQGRRDVHIIRQYGTVVGRYRAKLRLGTVGVRPGPLRREERGGSHHLHE